MHSFLGHPRWMQEDKSKSDVQQSEREGGEDQNRKELKDVVNLIQNPTKNPPKINQWSPNGNVLIK